jgi:hypothetical protein
MIARKIKILLGCSHAKNVGFGLHACQWSVLFCAAVPHEVNPMTNLQLYLASHEALYNSLEVLFVCLVLWHHTGTLPYTVPRPLALMGPRAIHEARCTCFSATPAIKSYKSNAKPHAHTHACFCAMFHLAMSSGASSKGGMDIAQVCWYVGSATCHC